MQPIYRMPRGDQKLLVFELDDIKSKDLVRFVFQTCGWKKKLTYRIAGVQPAPDSHLVYFDLRQAFEIHEGRMKETTME